MSFAGMRWYAYRLPLLINHINTSGMLCCGSWNGITYLLVTIFTHLAKTYELNYSTLGNCYNLGSVYFLADITKEWDEHPFLVMSTNANVIANAQCTRTLKTFPTHMILTLLTWATCRNRDSRFVVDFILSFKLVLPTVALIVLAIIPTWSCQEYWLNIASSSIMHVISEDLLFSVDTKSTLECHKIL